nr:CAP-Gly domain-containing linker protein 1 isoform X3 [Parasteatoda tepidariorum]
MSEKKTAAKAATSKISKGIPVSTKIPTSGRDSGTHSRSSSVSNLTSASDLVSEIGDASSASMHGFKLEDRIWVNGTKPGLIKFLGKTDFAPGIWAGVLLDEAVGKNDGSVAGVKYFKCEPNYGVFARPQKLTRTMGALPSDTMGSTTNLRNAGATMGSTTSIASLRSGVGLATPVNSRTPGTSVTSPTSATREVCSKLRLGKRVVASSTTGVKTGVLRFIGETDFAKGEWAGIELDEPVGKNDGSVAGKRYFTCPMKYGLFSPIHKISLVGGTSSSRTPSVRGAPIRRSTSRESISSSVSNCSKSSRVKLGVTSLTNTQKSRTTGVGIMTTSRALEEALKEKEQHIEQLLKEHDLGRGEVARLTSRCEEIERKNTELSGQQQQFDELKRGLEQQLSTEKRKLEDLQFQVEEGAILKSDLEMQLQQKGSIFKRLEDFLTKSHDNKFNNIKEILDGKEALTDSVETQESDGTSSLRQKIQELEENLSKLREEKDKSMNDLETMNLKFKEVEKKTEEQLYALNNSVQEKDDVITNLRSELNLQLEKLTNLVADNQALAEQMASQANTEKGHTEEVIKEFGEKVSNLSEELKLKSAKLQELELSVQERDNKIGVLENEIKSQTQKIAESEGLNQSLNESFELKSSELTEKITLQQSLESEVAAFKLKVETEIPEKEKKILDLVKQIEGLTCSLQEKEDTIAQKLSEITSLQGKVKELSDSLSEARTEHNVALENATISDKKSSENLAALQKELEILKEEKSEIKSKFDLELQKQKLETETACRELEMKTNLLSEKETEMMTMRDTIKTKEIECSDLQKKLSSLEESFESLKAEKGEVVEKINIKSMELQKLQSEFDAASRELIESKTALSTAESQLISHKQSIEEKEHEFSKLNLELIDIKNTREELTKDKDSAINSLKDKEELISSLEKQLSDFKSAVEVKTAELETNTKEIETNKKEIEMLSKSNKSKDEEVSQLMSKLELAQQNVEMLNKDSSEHVMTLQNELSKLKEDSDKIKTDLNQKLEEVQEEKEKLNSNLLNEEKLKSEKESLILKLENEMKSKEANLTEFSDQIEKLKKDMSALEERNKETKLSYEKELTKTKEEFDSLLKKKELDFNELLQKKDKINLELSELNECLAQKHEEILFVQGFMREKDQTIEKLSSQIQTLEKKVDAITKEKEDVQETLQKQLLTTKEGLSDELKQREEAVEKSLSKLSEYEKMLEDSKTQLKAKENDINSLNNIISEKDSQFDELSKMIEDSQSQLNQLKENNDKNVKQLEEKEIFINEFKGETENKLKEREESFKSEIVNLERIISGKDEVTQQKEEIILKLTSHNQQQEQQIELLNNEVEKAKLLTKEAEEVSGKTHSELIKKISDLEVKFHALIQEKEKIASEELKTRTDKKNLEEVRDALMKEKVLQQEVVKDKEAKLEALQAEVIRMQSDFSLHKQDLEQKLNISVMEKEAASELKQHLDLQHSVVEELQEELQKYEEKCKKLESQCIQIPNLTSENAQLAKKVEESEAAIKEKSKKLEQVEVQKQCAEESLSNTQNIFKEKEAECLSLKEQMLILQKGNDSTEQLKSRIKSLEEDNKLLKLKADMKPSSNDNLSSKTAAVDSNQMDSEEHESLLSQIDFLNSIIVDMKQKNEELSRENELFKNPIEHSDLNLNEVKKIPPRLFCDICDMFDLHDTDDCPKQESYIDDGEVPNLVPQGVRKLEERPYCNNCEVFGHWTLDCNEEEEY